MEIVQCQRKKNWISTDGKTFVFDCISHGLLTQISNQIYVPRVSGCLHDKMCRKFHFRGSESFDRIYQSEFEKHLTFFIITLKILFWGFQDGQKRVGFFHCCLSCDCLATLIRLLSSMSLKDLNCNIPARHLMDVDWSAFATNMEKSLSWLLNMLIERIMGYLL